MQPDTVDLLEPLQPCSDMDRAAGDTPIGSGTSFRSFLLLDYRQPWGRVAADDAVRDLLDPAEQSAVAAARETDQALRPFAIRPVQDRRTAPLAKTRIG